jgi:predicted metallopeptidase
MNKRKIEKHGIIGIISYKNDQQPIDSSVVTFFRLSVSGSLKVSKLVHCLNHIPESRSGFLLTRLRRGQGVDLNLTHQQLNVLTIHNGSINS